MFSQKTLIFQSDEHYIPRGKNSELRIELHNDEMVRKGSAYISVTELITMRLFVHRLPIIFVSCVATYLYVFLVNNVDYAQYSVAMSAYKVMIFIVHMILVPLIFIVGGFTYCRLLRRFKRGQVVYSKQMLYDDLQECKSNDEVTSKIRRALLQNSPDYGDDMYTLLLLSSLGCDISKVDGELFLKQGTTDHEDEENDLILNLLVEYVESGLSDPAYRDETINRVAQLEELSGSPRGEKTAEQRLGVISDLLNDGIPLRKIKSTLSLHEAFQSDVDGGEYGGGG